MSADPLFPSYLSGWPWRRWYEALVVAIRLQDMAFQAHFSNGRLSSVIHLKRRRTRRLRSRHFAGNRTQGSVNLSVELESIDEELKAENTLRGYQSDWR